MADDLNNIEAEIAQMQKVEDDLEYALAVQQIINAFNTVKTFIFHLPQEIKIADGHLTDGLYIRANGFILDGMVVAIAAQNGSLTVTKSSAVLGGKSFIAELSKKIKELVLKFQDQMKQKIAEKKERLMKELKNF